jgi:hypothetical protein
VAAQVQKINYLAMKCGASFRELGQKIPAIRVVFLMQKLNIHDVAGLTRYAIGAGIIGSSIHLTII